MKKRHNTQKMEEIHEDEDCKVPIQNLPQKISWEDAIEISYCDELDWIERKLCQGVSVLVACNRDIMNIVFQKIKKRLEKKEEYPVCVDIPTMEILHSTSIKDATNWIEKQLEQNNLSRKKKNIFAIPNLDLLLETIEKKSLMDVYSLITVLQKFSNVILLGFHEHGFSVPSHFSSFFCARKEIFGIPRHSLRKLILTQEAKKWTSNCLEIVPLYKYVSGLNPLQIRKSIEHISSLPEEYFSESQKIYTELREMHSCCDFETSHISLENDIAGYHEIKKTLQEEVIQPFYKKDETSNLAQVKEIERVIPKGMLFSGPSGTGKIYIAKALASSLDAVYSVVSCPELKMQWEKQGKNYLQSIFYKARHCAPSMVIFDKLDALASAKSYQSSGLEYSMLKEMVRQMGQIRKEEMVFIVGTTNFLSTLDPALLRPGRFELHIPFGYPNREERKAILELYKKKFFLPLSSAQIDEITQITSSYLTMENGIKFSVDHLYALCRFLHRKVILGNRQEIAKKDILDALGKIAKYENKGELSQEDKWRISIHEAGHCIVSRLLNAIEHITSISIIAEDVYLPDYNVVDTGYRRVILSKEALHDRICLHLAGKIAEEVILNDTSTICMLDLEQSTDIARDMVEIYGMGAHIESINYRKIRSPKNPTDCTRNLSLRSKNAIDSEVQNIISQQYKRCQKLIKQNVETLKILSSFLLEANTLDAKQLEEFFQKNPLQK